jgi:hypothetical protein
MRGGSAIASPASRDQRLPSAHEPALPSRSAVRVTTPPPRDPTAIEPTGVPPAVARIRCAPFSGSRDSDRLMPAVSRGGEFISESRHGAYGRFRLNRLPSSVASAFPTLLVKPTGQIRNRCSSRDQGFLGHMPTALLVTIRPYPNPENHHSMAWESILPNKVVKSTGQSRWSNQEVKPRGQASGHVTIPSVPPPVRGHVTRIDSLRRGRRQRFDPSHVASNAGHATGFTRHEARNSESRALGHVT